ncbi:MAG: hypothetical protein NPIRA06_28200 [Nitrospirales bacterium]|nr:MAG: hypothetical protein NPIRA06_28200 [Nitrospirales bacterium]
MDGRELIIRPSAIDERPYELNPNAEGNAWGTYVKVNSHGFRDREFHVEKERGVYRVIALGDSITFGKSLAVEETFPKQLEVLVSEKGHQVEVLNVGHGGYNTLQEVATLEHVGIKFKPNLVILGYCVNDLWDISPTAEYIKKVETYRSSPIYRSRLAQLIRVKLDRIQMALHNTRVNNEPTFLQNNKPYIVDVTRDPALQSLMANLAQLLPADGRGFNRYVPMYTSPPYIGRLRYALERLKGLEREHGFDVMVVLIPFLLETAETREAYHAVYKIVEHELSRLEFQVVTVYSRFESVGFKNLLMKEEDGIHPNALGHRVIATRLTEEFAIPSYAGSNRRSE